MKLERIIAVRTGKTIYRDEDKVIKVFDKDYAKSAILNEALNDARAEETSLHVPSLLNVGVIEGKWAIVTSFIQGKTLQQLLDENKDKEEEYLNLFVDLQIQIHQQKCPLLAKSIDKLNMKIAEANIDATTRYELHTRLESMPKHTCFLHGDFNPSNIIIQDKDKVPYIIDWSHASQGNASSDVARSYLLFYLTGNISLAEKYLSLYVEKSGTPKSYIQKWIPIIAASQLSVARPEEVEFLKQWINITDHE